MIRFINVASRDNDDVNVDKISAFCVPLSSIFLRVIDRNWIREIVFDGRVH